MDDNEKLNELKQWCEDLLNNYKPSEANYTNRFKNTYETGVIDTLKKVISKINKL